LKLTFDLSGYKPDDVSVKVNDNVLKGKFRVFFCY
jgi:HSP20 family molecular chaperone IbpA